MFAPARLLLTGLALSLGSGRAIRPDTRAEAHDGQQRRAAGPTSDLDAELIRWVAAGLLSRQQAAAILRHERASTVPAQPARATGRSTGAVVEALGYLGGALAVAGSLLLVARYWPDLATGTRLVVTGGAALALLAGGYAMRPARVPALARLQAVLWLAATAATGVFAVVVVRDWAAVDATETVLLTGAAAVAAESALLWWGHDRPVQQLCFLAAATVVLGAAVAEFATPPGPSGLAVWVGGVATVLAGVRKWLRHSVPTEAVGALAMFVGSIMASYDWQGAGNLLLIGGSAALLALVSVRSVATTRADQPVLGGFGGLGLLLGLPGAWDYFSREAAAVTGLVTFAAGAGTLLLGQRRLVRASATADAGGGLLLLIGTALLWRQWRGVAPVIGGVTAIALIGIGMLGHRLLLSVLGSAGLLLNVSWAIAWYFPGQGRAPLLTLVSGSLLLALAVLLARNGTGRGRRQDPGRYSRGMPITTPPKQSTRSGPHQKPPG